VAHCVAVVVGGARITGRQRYASDEVAGGAMGFFIGKFVFDKRKPNLSLTPLTEF
jgi:hypothetical protein